MDSERKQVKEASPGKNTPCGRGVVVPEDCNLFNASYNIPICFIPLLSAAGDHHWRLAAFSLPTVHKRQGVFCLARFLLCRQADIHQSVKLVLSPTSTKQAHRSFLNFQIPFSEPLQTGTGSCSAHGGQRLVAYGNSKAVIEREAQRQCARGL